MGIQIPEDAVLVYGSTGFTGRLIIAEAVRRQLPVILGGRGESVRHQARDLGLPFRVFAVESPEARVALRGCRALLNCAGPFSHTAAPLVDVCLDAGVHYLDINGEVEVFEALAAGDPVARDAGVMVLPGVGFDVVPTDCLAAHLLRRCPAATRLTLAFRIEGLVSRGTLLSMLENVGRAGLERRNGILESVEPGGREMVVDFGEGPVQALQVAWGDLSTAYRSTAIRDIQVYAAPSPGWRWILRLTAHLGRPLAKRWAQNLLRPLVALAPEGPSAEARSRGGSAVWGRVETDSGQVATARLTGPQPHDLTAQAAVAAAARVLAGDGAPGFQTPSMAFGPDFVLGLRGVTRIDL